MPVPKSSMQTTPVKIQATAQSTPQLASHPAAHSTTVHPMTLAAPGTPPYTGNPAPLDLALDIHVAEQVRLLTEIIHMMVGIEVELSSAAWPPPGGRPGRGCGAFCRALAGGHDLRVHAAALL